MFEETHSVTKLIPTVIIETLRWITMELNLIKNIYIQHLQ